MTQSSAVSAASRSNYEDLARDSFARDIGPAVMEALADPTTLDLAVNPDGQVFVERSNGTRGRVGIAHSDGVHSAVRLVAHACGREVGHTRMRLTARLPWSGDRFTAHLRPGEGGPAVTIRKHLRRSVTLAEYARVGALRPDWLEALTEAVEQRRRVLVVGGTGSGKTTLVNALLAEVASRCPTDRIYAIEEVRELRVENPDSAQIECESAEFRAEVEFAMRMNPGRLCVGEVRGGEALELIKAWTSGHEGGFATVHANSAASGVRRLGLLAEVGLGRALPEAMLADAIELVVVVKRGPGGRRDVCELARVDFDAGLRVTGL